MYESNPKYLTLKELRIATGLAHNTLLLKIERGLPYIQRGHQGKEWKFFLPAVIEWMLAEERRKYQDGQDSDANLRKRKLLAETTIAEVNAAKAKGQVADLDQVEREWSTAYATIRTRMLRIPARVAGALLGQTKERDIKDVLLDEIEEALRAISES